MKMKQRQIQMSVKQLSDDGSFEGLLSPYGNVDGGGDVVEPGSFTKTLQENGNVVPMLWQHKPECPIGDLSLIDRPDGLYCKGQLLLDLPEAQKAYKLLKAGIIKGLSIGYESIKSQVVEGVRHLKEIRLYEGSVVTFPMNQLATITAIKSLSTKGDFNDELTDIQLQNASDDYICALRRALCSLPWSGMSRADILSTADTVMQQFHDAFSEYLNDYLDYLTRTYGIDTKAWSGKHETKEGRKLSAATKETLSTAHQHLKDANDLMSSLLTDEAGDIATSTVDDDGESKSEPEYLHSAAQSLKSMRALFSQA